MKKLFFLAFPLLFPLSLIAQLIYLPYNREHYYQLENALNSGGKSFHTGIKPFSATEVKETIGSEIPLYKDLNKKKFSIQPVAELSGGFELNKSESSLKATAGVRTWFSHNDKISLDLSFYGSTSNQPFYIDSVVNKTDVMINENVSRSGILDHNWNVFLFTLNYKPSKYFLFQAGNGKFFIGDGYRSMLLSDVAPAYPYLAIHTNVWKFKYLNLYTMMKDFKFDSNGGLIQTNKFTSIHYLSWNVHRKFVQVRN